MALHSAKRNFEKIDLRDAKGAAVYLTSNDSRLGKFLVRCQVHALYLFHPCYSRNCRNVLLTVKHSWGIGFFELFAIFYETAWTACYVPLPQNAECEKTP